MWELDHKESWAPKNWCFWTGVLEKTLESPLDCKQIQPVHIKGNSVLNTHWKDWCWSWNSNPLATWCEELTHWKRPWGWERLRAGGEGDDRGWDGWMASPTWWTWVWASSSGWWWTGRPGVLHSMESQRVGHDWMGEKQQHRNNSLGANRATTATFRRRRDPAPRNASVPQEPHSVLLRLIISDCEGAVPACFRGFTQGQRRHISHQLLSCPPRPSYGHVLSERVQLLSRVWLFVTPWAIAHQAPPSMGCSRQESWSGLPFPSPGESFQPRDGAQVSCIGRRILQPLSHQGSPVNEHVPRVSLKSTDTFCFLKQNRGLPLFHMLCWLVEKQNKKEKSKRNSGTWLCFVTP